MSLREKKKKKTIGNSVEKKMLGTPAFSSFPTMLSILSENVNQLFYLRVYCQHLGESKNFCVGKG